MTGRLPTLCSLRSSAYYFSVIGVFCEAIATHWPSRFWKTSVQL
jgi:hypothetical protein